MTAKAEHPQVPGDRPFIGREKELAAIYGALERACAGHGCVVMLAGPPGIGKSRTTQRVAEHAATQGVLVLWGRCTEEAGAPPYWPWLQAMRRYVEMHDKEQALETLGIAAAHLAGLDAALASKLPPQQPHPAAADAAQARFQLFDAISGFWERAAARQPILLVLEDVHAADTPSLRLLEFIGRNLATQRMLLLGSFRDAEVTRAHPLFDVLGMLAREEGTQRLTVRGFSAEETAEFVRCLGSVFSTGLAAAMHERTDGHPLFLVEIARLLSERRSIDGDDRNLLADLQRVPAGVREVIGSRLNRLSPVCSHVLSTASVVGRRFDFELLAAILDETSEDECLATLEEARAASLVEQGTDPAAYQFTHALIRDTLYDDMPLPRRLRLHSRIASTLERQHGADATPWLSALAHHFYEARIVGSAAKAVEYLTRAARHAEATLAYEEAARLYRIALQTLEPGCETECCSLTIGLGEVLLKTAEHEGAFEAFTSAATTARRIGAPDALARAALGYETASWRAGGAGIVAAALIKEALAANSPLDGVQRARLLAALCRALVYANRIDAAVAIHGQAVAMARRLGDEATLFLALSAIVPARWVPGIRPLRLAAGREAMQIAERNGDPQWAVAHLSGWHIGDLIESGDSEAAKRAAAFGPDAAMSRHQPYEQTVLIDCRAMLALHAGRFSEAEGLATLGMQYAARIGQSSGAAAVQLFTLRREQGRLAELAPVLDHFQRMVAASSTWQPGYIVLCCELGRGEQAQAAFERLAAKRFAIADDGVRSGSLVYLAEACAWLGDVERARLLYDLLLPHAGTGIVFGAHVASLGCADRLLGMLAAMMKRYDDAEKHFLHAVSFDESSGGRPWLAHSRYQCAAMLIDRKQGNDLRRAGELLDAAFSATRELGMPVLEQRVLALQKSLSQGGRKPYPAGLSVREVQILRMVAEGKTNHDIAKALFRSNNTVNNHVRNILAKVDAANRAEAAAFAARHGLLE